MLLPASCTSYKKQIMGFSFHAAQNKAPYCLRYITAFIVTKTFIFVGFMDISFTLLTKYHGWGYESQSHGTITYAEATDA